MIQRSNASERGQVLAVVGLSLVAIVAMVGLVIDVGFAWGQQRDAQNGADAAAHAGAIVLLDRLTGVAPPAGGWDEAVHQKVQLAAISNGMTVPEAQYTRWNGQTFDPPIYVGPSDGTANPPTDAQGVAVVGSKTFEPFIAQIIGFTSFTANTTATAVAGNISDPCDTIEGCVLLPIAFPATMVTCSENGQSSIPAYDVNGEPVPWPDNTRVIMPLCGGNPGSVGWIDWTPTEGGAAELEEYVRNPPLLDIAQPSWQFVTQTGGIDRASLEAAINTYAGQIVLLPLFDSTCGETPSNPQLDGCAPEDTGASGSNQWYHIPDPGFAAFRLNYPKGAYTSGSNSAICDTGNGSTDCLVGTFVNYVGSGTVGPTDPNNKNFGIQLIH